MRASTPDIRPKTRMVEGTGSGGNRRRCMRDKTILAILLYSCILALGEGPAHVSLLSGHAVVRSLADGEPVPGQPLKVMVEAFERCNFHQCLYTARI